MPAQPAPKSKALSPAPKDAARGVEDDAVLLAHHEGEEERSEQDAPRVARVQGTDITSDFADGGVDATSNTGAETHVVRTVCGPLCLQNALFVRGCDSKYVVVGLRQLRFPAVERFL